MFSPPRPSFSFLSHCFAPKLSRLIFAASCTAGGGKGGLEICDSSGLGETARAQTEQQLIDDIRQAGAWAGLNQIVVDSSLSYLVRLAPEKRAEERFQLAALLLAAKTRLEFASVSVLETALRRICKAWNTLPKSKNLEQSELDSAEVEIMIKIGFDFDLEPPTSQIQKQIGVLIETFALELSESQRLALHREALLSLRAATLDSWADSDPKSVAAKHITASFKRYPNACPRASF